MSVMMLERTKSAILTEAGIHPSSNNIVVKFRQNGL